MHGDDDDLDDDRNDYAPHYYHRPPPVYGGAEDGRRPLLNGDLSRFEPPQDSWLRSDQLPAPARLYAPVRVTGDASACARVRDRVDPILGEYRGALAHVLRGSHMLVMRVDSFGEDTGKLSLGEQAAADLVFAHVSIDPSLTRLSWTPVEPDLAVSPTTKARAMATTRRRAEAAAAAAEAVAAAAAAAAAATAAADGSGSGTGAHSGAMASFREGGCIPVAAIAAILGVQSQVLYPATWRGRTVRLAVRGMEGAAIDLVARDRAECEMWVLGLAAAHSMQTCALKAVSPEDAAQLDAAEAAAAQAGAFSDLTAEFATTHYLQQEADRRRMANYPPPGHPRHDRRRREIKEEEEEEEERRRRGGGGGVDYSYRRPARLPLSPGSRRPGSPPNGAIRHLPNGETYSEFMYDRPTDYIPGSAFN